MANKKQKVFAIDMDSTITQCNEYWINRIKETHNIKINKNEITHWDAMEEIFAKKASISLEDSKKIVESYLYEEGFFGNQLPIKDAIDVINFLIEEYNDIVVIATKPPFSSKYAFSEKFYWVKKYFPNHFDKIKFIATPDKNFVLAEYLIDDSPKNLLLSKGIHKTIAFTQPWNKTLKIGPDIDFRIKNWKEMIKLRKKIN